MRVRISAKLFSILISMLFLATTLLNVTRMDDMKKAFNANLRNREKVIYYFQEPEIEELLPTQMPEAKEEVVKLTAEEKEVLLKIAMAEAEGETTEGKVMVMAVVLNRMENEGFPDTAKEVIYQKDQFAVMGKNGRYFTTTPDEDCKKALEMIQSGWDESKGALYFESEEEVGWHARNLEYLFTIGGHRFYR